MTKTTVALFALASLPVAASASVVITEAHPSGSGNGTYGADWFEVTNTGGAAVDITGWKVDDSSNALASALALRLITSIPAGGSAIFIESNASGTNDATVTAAFINAWFGGVAPSGFLIGTYGGSGIGLSTTSDAVVLFDALGDRVTGVQFGAATTGVSFDNSAGLGGTSAPFPTLSTLSVAGVNGAYVAGAETGSPGVVPAPGAIALLGAGGLLVGRRRRA